MYIPLYVSSEIIVLPDSNTITLLLGGFLLIIGVLGGGIEAKEIRIPSIAKGPRILAGVIGAVLVFFALIHDPLTNTEKKTSEPPKDSASSTSPAIKSPSQHIVGDFDFD